MNQVQALIDEATELRRALIAVLLTIGGSVEVNDSTVETVDLDLDFISTLDNDGSHTIMVKRRGAPDA